MKNTATNMKKMISVLLSAIMIFSVSAIAASAKIHIMDAWLSFDVWTGNGDSSVRIGDDYLTKDFRDEVKPENFEKLIRKDNGFELSDCYTVSDSDGVTVITIKEEYLKTLNDGNYYIDAVFKNADIPLRLFVVTKKYVLPDASFDFDDWYGGEPARVKLDPNKLSFTFSADLFERLTHNGEEVSPEYYSVSEFAHTVMIILAEEYVDTLPHGAHTFEAEFMNIDITLNLDIVNSYNRWGDINCDNRITAADARLCLRASAKLEKLNAHQTFAADVLGTGKITSASARKILRVSAGLDVFDSIKVEMKAGEEYVVGPLHNTEIHRWVYDVTENGMEVNETVKTELNPNPGTSTDNIFTFTAKEAGTYHVNLRLQCPWNSEILAEYLITFIVK